MSRTAFSAEGIERQILTLRGHRVILDAHLAVLYRVGTRTLKQAVRHNLDRFPEDFMFQLTWEEGAVLRSQFVILIAPSHWLENRSSPGFPSDGHRSIFDAIRQLMIWPKHAKRRNS